MQERTNPRKGEYSPTGVESAFCYRKFYFNKVLRLKCRYEPIPLLFGTAIHKGVETFYVSKTQMHWKEASLLAAQAFTADWISYGVEGDDKRNISTGLAIMEAYCQYYKDDQAEIAPEFIEAQQWVEMPNGTHMLFKIDRVRIEGDRKVVVDTKTSSMPLTDYYFRGYENNLQTSLYYYGVSKVLGECDAIQIDGIKVPPPPIKSATTPFARRTFLREDLQVADALNTWCRITDYINIGLDIHGEDEEGLSSYMYCNQTMCGNYGGCDYLPICKYGFKHPSVQVDFVRE